MNLHELYGNKYRIVDDGTNSRVPEERVSCQEIPGKYGAVYFYGSGKLAARLESIKIATKYEQIVERCIQNGDDERTFVFSPDKFEQVAIMLKSRKKKVLSEEAIKGLKARLASSN